MACDRKSQVIDGVSRNHFHMKESEMKRNNTSLLILVATLATIFACCTQTALAQSILSDDAHTSSVTKDLDTNFGTNPNLVVSPTNTAYLKFKLTPTVPVGTQGSDVSKATLKIYVGNVSTPGTVDVLLAAESWNEKSITGRTPPATGDVLATGVVVDTNKKGQFLVVDVTSAVRQWLDTSTNYGLVLIAHDATSVAFDSKENSQTSHEPELIVALNSRMGPQGPQGERGEKGETGATGTQGPEGAQGPQGAQGERGDKGETGATGTQGPEGAQGPQGQMGPAGPQGEKGDTGAKGDPGPTGPSGSAPNKFDPTLVGLIRWDLLLVNPAYTLPGGAAGAAFDGENLWVTNLSGGTVTKLRPSDGTILGTFNAGTAPIDVAWDGANIWIANASGNCVTKLRGSDGVVLATYVVFDSVNRIAFDGTFIWVTCSSKITVLRTDGTLRANIPTNNSPNGGIAFDGTNIWFVNYFTNTVTKRRASTQVLLGTFSVGSNPQDVAFDGKNIWVTNWDSDNVTKIRPNDGVVLGTFSVGSHPSGITFDGENIWVANTFGNSVSKLRPNDGAVLDTITVGVNPVHLVFDGHNVWVSNFDGTITKIRIY